MRSTAGGSSRHACALAMATVLSLALGACTGTSGSDAGDASGESEASAGCAPNGAEYGLELTYESGDCAHTSADAGASSTLSVRRSSGAAGGDRATVEATGADAFVCEGELVACVFRAACVFGTAPNRSLLELSLEFSEASVRGAAVLQRGGAQPCAGRYRIQGARR